MRWAALALLAVACAHSRQPRPSARAVAEGTAEDTDSGEVQPRASPRAYRHYLDALLAKNADDFTTAASELREAMVYDPESPYLHSVLAEVLIKQGRLNDAEEELFVFRPGAALKLRRTFTHGVRPDRRRIYWVPDQAGGEIAVTLYGRNLCVGWFPPAGGHFVDARWERLQAAVRKIL